jgi:hypothetical protein
VATLQSKDFTKAASGGPYAGMSRDDIFLKKIKDKKLFFIGPNDRSGTKVTGVAYNKKKRIFSYYEGNKKSAVKEVPVNKVFKDKDFGGGAGSGGGAEDTKWTESMQCYYCAYVFNIAKKKVTSVSDAELKKSKKFVYADGSLEDCWKNGPKDWIETDVYIKTANKLYEKFKTKMRGDVYFHRGSKFMDNVYKAKAECHKLDKKNGTPQAPGSFSNDKWNPGDIWASTEAPNSSPLMDYVGSWGELNSAVYQMAKNGKLLGISLKKISPTATQAKLQEFNTPSQMEKRESYRFDGFTYGKTGDFFSSQDIYLHTSVGDVQFRTFGGETSWQGEIKGGAAAGGKIGGGNVHFYCNQVFKKGIYGSGDTEKYLLSWIKSNEATGKFQERMYELYKKYNGKSSPKKPLLEEEEFYAKLAKADYKFKNSKMICMEFLDVLMSGTAAKRHDFTTKMFRYAQSDTDQSSYFVKVY